MAITHKRHEKKLSNGFVILFADDESNYGYGPHVWTLHTDLPYILDCDDVISFAMEYYCTDRDHAEDDLNPDDIVDSARVWDDAQFVSELWQAMEYGQVAMRPGFRTYNGAVVLDRESAQMTYSYQPEKFEEGLE
jgi:hypothetical protein